MKLVYYAHSYRRGDTEVVKHFADLMAMQGLIVSLDPPSNRLNAAKPERHLRSTDALVAVLTARENGPSPYILFEIMLGVRARKPVIVFVEDELPDECVPYRILQRRFSRRSLLREVRTHLHAIQILNTYLGDRPPPLYQPALAQRSCVVIGAGNLSAAVHKAAIDHIESKHYSPHILEGRTESRLADKALYEQVLTAELALIFIERRRQSAGFLVGLAVGYTVPSIILTLDPDYRYADGVPEEYQPKMIDGASVYQTTIAIDQEISIFEEDYVDIEEKFKVEEYSKMLLDIAGEPGRYQDDLRSVFVRELVMGDKNINTGIVGAMGNHAVGTVNDARIMWGQIAPSTDLRSIAAELGALRSELRVRARTLEEDRAVTAVGEAEREAESGNGPGVLQKLAGAGRWAWEVAKEISVKAAAEVIATAAGIK